MTEQTEQTFRPCVTVPLPVEIDVTNCAAAEEHLHVALQTADLVIADMTRTGFCDSSGIRVLLTAHDRASARGSELRIAARPASAVTRALTILGLDRVLPVYASVKDATPA